MSCLDDFIELISLKVDISLNARACGNWRLDAIAKGETSFHFATQNQALLTVPNVGQWRLNEGDLVIFPREIDHSLSPIEALEGEQQLLATARAQHLPGTSLICGKVRFKHSSSELLLNTLPNVFVLTHDEQTPWLSNLLNLLLTESLRDDTTHGVILDRLCELLFSYALRHFIENSEQTIGVLALFSHAKINKALQAFHQAPQKPWQLATLAHIAAMSRTQFAETFKSLSGWTAMQYITWWRMQLAWNCLESGTPVALTAEQVGYQSEAAFSRAFRKHFSQGAGEVRRGSKI